MKTVTSATAMAKYARKSSTPPTDAMKSLMSCPFRLDSLEIVRHEPARVPGDRRIVLADPDPRRAVPDDPRADHRVVSFEMRERGVFLVDPALLAVRPARDESAALAPQAHVRALAREDRLPHVIPPRKRRGVEEARQQV